MKTPPGLQPLIDDGVIDEVIRSLKSGKEATVISCAPAPSPLREGSLRQGTGELQPRRRGRRLARSPGLRNDLAQRTWVPERTR